jgi:uncharacterized membrane protein
MNVKPILYLGDTSLTTAAGYLAGLMSLWRYGYDYVPSDVEVNGQAAIPRSLYIISDYPARLIDDAAQRQVVAGVEAGAGLIMVGGWESFHGVGGDWDRTPIAQILPVEIETADDRVNCDQPALVHCVDDHPICAGLPWDDRPPTVGGFNRFTPKPGTETVLEVHQFSAEFRSGEGVFTPTQRDPLLVVGKHGRGRTAALATDLAPHWVGGLIDWGTGPRITATAPDSWPIEVGENYARFIHNLLTWAGGFGAAPPPAVETTIHSAVIAAVTGASSPSIPAR